MLNGSPIAREILCARLSGTIEIPGHLLPTPTTPLEEGTTQKIPFILLSIFRQTLTSCLACIFPQRSQAYRLRLVYNRILLFSLRSDLDLKVILQLFQLLTSDRACYLENHCSALLVLSTF
jgi:hypothetical protein